MKRSFVLAALAAVLALGSYAIFAQQQSPPPQQDQQPTGGGMMGGGMMGGGMMGGGMMGQRSGAWEAPPSAAGRKNPVPADPTSVAAGKALFGRYCASCHGPEGKGNIGPDLTAPDVQNQADGALFWKIGQGKSPMPSFADTLTARQRWDIVNYIRTLAAAPKSGDAPAGGAGEGQTIPPMPPGVGRGMMQGGYDGMSPGVMQGDPMGRGTGRGMMQGRGPLGTPGCAGCRAAWGALAHESIVATSDGGVVVAVAGKLIKYNASLKKVAEANIDVDWAQVHRRMQQIVQNCPWRQQRPRAVPPPSSTWQGQPNPQ